MNAGKTLFAQVMERVPWKTFGRIIERHDGDALNQRNWRTSHALAMRLIARARSLYAKEPTGLELDATVYALDATTIDLCV